MLKLQDERREREEREEREKRALVLSLERVYVRVWSGLLMLSRAELRGVLVF